jgi:hypothetical protein
MGAGDTAVPTIDITTADAAGIAVGSLVGIILYVIISLILSVFVYKETLNVWGIKETASTGVRFGIGFACVFFFPITLLALIGKAIVNASEKNK